MKVDDIRKILVVGTGTMGQKIALQCARFGYEVVAYDPVSKSLENARVKIPAFAADLIAKQKMTPRPPRPPCPGSVTPPGPRTGPTPTC